MDSANALNIESEEGMENRAAQKYGYIFRAALGNPNRPELGYIVVDFPIPDAEYDRIFDKLAVLQIGDPLKRDCCVGTVDSNYQYLNRLQHHTVTLDELDYLAKRLFSFFEGEDVQFQAMAYALALTDIKDLINLTFCCQQATVITDFTDLEEVGREHYMNLHGGGASTKELDNLDGRETAIRLIRDGGGTVTPYGVVYRNSMELESLYNGKQFPAYMYDNYFIMLAVSPKHGLEEGQNPEYIYLPASRRQLERTLIRAGTQGGNDMELCLEYSELPKMLEYALDLERLSVDDLTGLNKICQAIKGMDKAGIQKVNAAIDAACTTGIVSICRLLENLDQFDFIPDIHSAEEYGKYMIRESGYFAYDENLEKFYDYRQYGEQRLRERGGWFSDYGYIVYNGVQPLSELLQANPSTQDEVRPSPQFSGP